MIKSLLASTLYFLLGMNLFASEANIGPEPEDKLPMKQISYEKKTEVTWAEFLSEEYEEKKNFTPVKITSLNKIIRSDRDVGSKGNITLVKGEKEKNISKTNK